MLCLLRSRLVVPVIGMRVLKLTEQEILNLGITESLSLNIGITENQNQNQNQNHRDHLLNFQHLRYIQSVNHFM
jgi:hypothetical protein